MLKYPSLVHILVYLARVGVISVLISVPVLGACVDFPIIAEKLAHAILCKPSHVHIQEVLDSLGGVSCLSSCHIFQGLSGEQTAVAVAVIRPEDQNPLGTLKNTIVSKVPNKFSNKDCIFASFMCNFTSLLFLIVKDKVTKLLLYSLECEILGAYWMEHLQNFLRV